jgi:hypothetical protein
MAGRAVGRQSALTSWFALHPPEGIDVVCFFVTGRLSEQADSPAFTEALLACLAGQQLPSLVPGRGTHTASSWGVCPTIQDLQIGTAFFSGSDGYMFTSTERASATQWRRYL